MNARNVVKTKKNICVIAAIAISGILAIGMIALPGCSSQSQPQQEEKVRIIGVEKEDSLNMNFLNDTGKTITKLQAKKTDDAASIFGNDLLESESWESGTKIALFCDAYEIDMVASTPESERIENMQIRPAYDLQITFEDESTGVLHGVTFEEAELVNVCYDEETKLLYFTYTVEGSEASTLDAEKAIKMTQEAAAVAAAQVQAQAEADAAAALAAAEEAAQEDYSHVSTAGAESASAPVEQQQDSCLGNDVVLRN